MSAVIVGLFFTVAVVGPWLAPYAPDQIALAHQFELPSSAHWLGTADNGVDILSVLLHGARISALVAVGSVTVSVVFGTLIGALSGYRGGRLDHWITGVADLVQAFPAILLNIALLALVARPGVMHLVLALSASGWVLYARVSRAQAMLLREREFVAAARALGASEARVLLRHVLPNLVAPVLVQATAGLGSAILVESTLSFLGLGAGNASWGALLDQGSSVLLRFPHVALISGFAIALTVLSFNLTGDSLRDRLAKR